MNLVAFKLNSDQPSFCAVVGLGLVGSSIARDLTQRFKKLDHAKVDWNSEAENCIEKIIDSAGWRRGSRLELVWTAGKAGFTAPRQQIDAEVAFFKAVILGLHERCGHKLKVNMISSAGGIYEGSGHVANLAAISPSRAYAEGKLEQEELLLKSGIDHRIYRVSSVYGMGGSRMGLISSMLTGAIAAREVKIFAQQNTMRDYIFNQDVARVVVEDIASNHADGVFILASGRAVSINMLINMVAKTTRRRVKAYYQSDASNENDISFSRHVIRRISAPTSLEEGIALMHKQLALRGST